MNAKHQETIDKLFKSTILTNCCYRDTLALLFDFMCFSNFAIERNPSAVSKEGFVVVSDLERLEKIKDEELRELRVGGLWWVLDEKKQTNVGGKRHRANAALWWALI